MKRNFDLIRAILTEIESGNVELSGYTKDEILYHKALVVEAKLVHGLRHVCPTPRKGEIRVFRKDYKRT